MAPRRYDGRLRRPTLTSVQIDHPETGFALTAENPSPNDWAPAGRATRRHATRKSPDIQRSWRPERNDTAPGRAETRGGAGRRGAFIAVLGKEGRVRRSGMQEAFQFPERLRRNPDAAT
ncbi:MAG: hypothetical protein OXT72_04360 [Gammaproteobacteria bacterium]|nr:hypothetical protein [Gammaproteobacteria bacterium]MDE0248766.1 hypothetical protein [Gammaproteobacteria bacterium]